MSTAQICATRVRWLIDDPESPVRVVADSDPYILEPDFEDLDALELTHRRAAHRLERDVSLGVGLRVLLWRALRCHPGREREALMIRLRFGLLLLLAITTGCNESTSSAGDGGGSMDSGATIADAGYDDAATDRDAAAPTDAGGDFNDGAASDGSSGSDDAGALSDAGPVECTGAHPVIGPPRTCERGSCLCVETDTCYPVDQAVLCCPADAELRCAPPVGACMGEHPIVGPPRTCEPGMCYCPNPDACFTPDRAVECCAVDVVCVPET